MQTLLEIYKEQAERDSDYSFLLALDMLARRGEEPKLTGDPATDRLSILRQATQK